MWVLTLGSLFFRFSTFRAILIAKASVLLGTGWLGIGQTTIPNARINAGKEGAPISPYIYGQFLEHSWELGLQDTLE